MKRNMQCIAAVCVLILSLSRAAADDSRDHMHYVMQFLNYSTEKGSNGSDWKERLANISQQKSFTTHTQFTAGPQYAMGPRGKHAPTIVAHFDISKKANTEEVVIKASAQETETARIEDASGTSYAMQALKKELEKAGYDSMYERNGKLHLEKTMQHNSSARDSSMHYLTHIKVLVDTINKQRSTSMNSTCTIKIPRAQLAQKMAEAAKDYNPHRIE